MRICCYIAATLRSSYRFKLQKEMLFMKIINSLVCIFFLIILLTGCSSSNEDRLSDYTVSKRIAAENLSLDDRKSILPWKIEHATSIPLQKVPSYIQTAELSSEARIYKVQFYTSKDERVGPIGIYVDVDSETVIGRELRN